MSKAELLQIAKPILFNTEMVKAILDGRKTQTRRVCNVSSEHTFKVIGTESKTKEFVAVFEMPKQDWFDGESPCHEYIKPKYKKGDVLWVREPAEITSLNSVNMTICFHYGADKWIVNEANKMPIPERFIDMSKTNQIIENFDLIKPKWIREVQGIPNGCIKEMARIFLKVTDVRVERLQDIEDNTDNFQAEGYPDSYELKEAKGFYSNDMHGEVDYCDDCMEEWWTNLWNSTAKDGSKWADNPYVFVYEFERIEL